MHSLLLNKQHKGYACLSMQLQLQLILKSLQIMKERASAFKTLKVAESLASAKVNHMNFISDTSYGFAVLNNQIIMVHGAFYIYISDFLPYFM